jgi:hypothetical protein
MDECAQLVEAIQIVLRRLEAFSSSEREVLLGAFTAVLARVDAAAVESGGSAGRASPAS